MGGAWRNDHQAQRAKEMILVMSDGTRETWTRAPAECPAVVCSALFASGFLTVKGDQITVASVASLNQLRRVFGPPHEHPTGEGTVVSKSHDGLGHLIDGEQSRGNATRSTL